MFTVTVSNIQRLHIYSAWQTVSTFGLALAFAFTFMCYLFINNIFLLFNRIFIAHIKFEMVTSKTGALSSYLRVNYEAFDEYKSLTLFISYLTHQQPLFSNIEKTFRLIAIVNQLTDFHRMGTLTSLTLFWCFYC